MLSFEDKVYGRLLSEGRGKTAGMKLPKLVWVLSSTLKNGLFRAWPEMHYEGQNGPVGAKIECTDSYTNEIAKSGQHAPLTVRLADYSKTPTAWTNIRGTFRTLDLAKSSTFSLLAQHPEMIPKDLVVNSSKAHLAYVVDHSLNLSGLREKFPMSQIYPEEFGFRIVMPRVASSKENMRGRLKEAISFFNSGVDVEFSEDFLNFSPDEELINKSENPLWVLHNAGPGTVLIRRVTR